MSRYIDADAINYHEDDAVYRHEIDLIPKADVVPKDIADEAYAHGYTEAESEYHKLMENRVEVVRCKDCKYYLHSNEVCKLIDARLHFYETDKVWTEDCFCCWGERREDERTNDIP